MEKKTHLAGGDGTSRSRRGRNTSGAQADKHHKCNILFVAEIELKCPFLGHVSLMFDRFICSSVRTLHIFPFRYS
jgi:hypothetical protein